MDTLVVVQIAIASAQDILFALAFGALVCRAMLGRQYKGDTAASSALGYFRFIALSALVITCCLYLWLQAAVMGRTPFAKAGPIVSTVLIQSHFGTAWLVEFVGAMCACLGAARLSRTASWLSTSGMAVYVAGKAAAGHAADAGDFTLPEAVHILHLGATALWAGTVIVAAAVLWFWNTASPSAIPTKPTSCVSFCTRLSQLATISLAIVMITGIYNAAQDTLFVTVPLLSRLYGRIMTLKLALVALAMTFGGYNRLIFLRRLQETAAYGGLRYRGAQRGFNLLLVLEAIMMVAVLATAGVLGHTSPSN